MSHLWALYLQIISAPIHSSSTALTSAHPPPHSQLSPLHKAPLHSSNFCIPPQSRAFTFAQPPHLCSQISPLYYTLPTALTPELFIHSFHFCPYHPPSTVFISTHPSGLYPQFSPLHPPFIHSSLTCKWSTQPYCIKMSPLHTPTFPLLSKAHHPSPTSGSYRGYSWKPWIRWALAFFLMWHTSAGQVPVCLAIQVARLYKIYS